jgi:hypothetical protein
MQKIKFSRPLSQATASNHHTVFTSTLPLSEGRAGDAWEISHKRMLFLTPQNKASPTFPIIFLFIYSSTILSTLLSVPSAFVRLMHYLVDWAWVCRTQTTDRYYKPGQQEETLRSTLF